MANKKAEAMGLGDLLPIGMTFVVITIGLAIGLQVSGEVKNDIGSSANMCPWNSTYNSTSGFCANASNYRVEITGPEYNATVEGIKGLAKFPTKLPIIATVVVAAILIGILVRSLVRAV